MSQSIKESMKDNYVPATCNMGGRRYDYLCDEKLRPGDNASVITSRGEATETVEAVFEKTEVELAIPLKQYKKILRKQ